MVERIVRQHFLIHLDAEGIRKHRAVAWEAFGYLHRDFRHLREAGVGVPSVAELGWPWWRSWARSSRSFRVGRFHELSRDP